MEATFQKYPAYKNSGVDWLRGFAEHWEVKKLKFCLKSSHDRFLIIDQKELYHMGAFLKDLGKKPVVSKVELWFAFSKMDHLTDLVLKQLKENA